MTIKAIIIITISFIIGLMTLGIVGVAYENNKTCRDSITTYSRFRSVTECPPGAKLSNFNLNGEMVIKCSCSKDKSDAGVD